MLGNVIVLKLRRKKRRRALFYFYLNVIVALSSSKLPFIVDILSIIARLLNNKTVNKTAI